MGKALNLKLVVSNLRWLLAMCRHSWGWGGGWGGGVGPSKIESLGEGIRNFLLEKGDKPVKGGKGERGLPLFYYFTVQSYLLFVRGK